MQIRLIAATLLALSVAASAFGQLVCQLGPTQTPFNIYHNAPPTAYASDELGTIYRLLCPTGNCGRVDFFINDTAPNALTITEGPGVSLIAYNPNFMGQIYQQIGPAATFGIVAHEFGHHLDFNTSPPWMNTSWSRELKADAWAGCALAKRGFPPAQLEMALRAISMYPSPTHPAWNLRIPALEQGYFACGGAISQLPWRR